MYDDFSSNKDTNQSKIDSQGKYSVKTEILKTNIYGVDLDIKAVEITKLNLLLKASEKGRKLPEEVDLHIKHGNSLIHEENVTKYPFIWRDDFQEGSFDVIIGNPPYIRNTELSSEDKNYFTDKYFSAYKQYDIYLLFFELGIKLLKNGRYLGFITSNKFLASDYGQKLREFILNNCKIISLIDVSNLRVFKDASTYPVIVILQKDTNENTRKSNTITFQKINNVEELNSKNNIVSIKQAKFIDTNGNRLIVDTKGVNSDIIKKMEKGSLTIKDYFDCQRGSPKNKITILDKATPNTLPCIISRDVSSYSYKISKNFFIASKLQDKILSKPKILIPRTVLSLKATFDEGNKFIMDRIYYLIPKEGKDINMKYVTALLNSRLIDFYYKTNFGTTHVGGGYLDLRGTQIVKLPIILTNQNATDTIAQHVDKIITLNKRLVELGDKTTSETKEINDKIDKLNEQINEEIYKIYGITEDEKEIIKETNLILCESLQRI